MVTLIKRTYLILQKPERLLLYFQDTIDFENIRKNWDYNIRIQEIILVLTFIIFEILLTKLGERSKVSFKVLLKILN